MMTGTTIRNKRIKAGWTQEELAKKAKISRRHLSNVELGTTNFGDETYKRVVSVFSKTK